MRVFITGATGFIGTALIKELQGAGHQVVGLARSEKSAEKLKALGAEAHYGSLEDLESLKSGAKAADGVIHLAFDNSFGDFEKIIENDLKAVQAIGEALAGTDKPFVSTSVTTMVKTDGTLATEAMPATEGTPGYFRSAAEETVLSLADQHVRSAVVRLAPCVHDTTDQGFAAALAGIAQQSGASAYVAAGKNHWPAVHRLDAAKLFRLALENAPAGTRLHAVGEEEISLKDIAQAIGERFDLPVKSVTAEQAEKQFTWLTPFVTFDNPTSSEATQKLVGWKPVGPSLLADIKNS